MYKNYSAYIFYGTLYFFAVSVAKDSGIRICANGKLIKFLFISLKNQKTSKCEVDDGRNQYRNQDEFIQYIYLINVYKNKLFYVSLYMSTLN